MFMKPSLHFAPQDLEQYILEYEMILNLICKKNNIDKKKMCNSVHSNWLYHIFFPLCLISPFFGPDQSFIRCAEGGCPPLRRPVWQTQQGVHALPLGGEGPQKVSGRREKSQRLRAQLFQVSAVQAFSARLGHEGHVKWTLLLFYFFFKCVGLWT